MYAFKEVGSLLFFHYGSAVAVGSVCKPQVASEMTRRLVYLHNNRKQHMHLLKRDVSSSGAEVMCTTLPVFYLPGLKHDEQKAQTWVPSIYQSDLFNPRCSLLLIISFIDIHEL